MELMLPFDVPSFEPRIRHQDRVMLIGSCFTRHMHGFLHRTGFRAMQNPHGTLFNPLSIARCLNDLAEERVYTEKDLHFNESTWFSWAHHGDFSDRFPERALERINASIRGASAFLREAQCLILTLGSAFAYLHLESGGYVANNHRVPASAFRKDLLNTAFMQEHLQQALNRWRVINPALRIIVTVSPVRHIRDGLVENNRSKARLIELVHSLQDTWYFPAYEAVIDVLRDHRFYDIDLVHPNYAATAWVWERFREHCLHPDDAALMQSVQALHTASAHRSRDAESPAHQAFLAEQRARLEQLQQKFPYLETAELQHLFQAGV
jgi:hypothetical protein